jgi:hypothetical protein
VSVRLATGGCSDLDARGDEARARATDANIDDTVAAHQIRRPRRVRLAWPPGVVAVAYSGSLKSSFFADGTSYVARYPVLMTRTSTRVRPPGGACLSIRANHRGIIAQGSLVSGDD